ncbi:hypothetical protein N7539_003029 [Penicillium diatomitis]|uniref:Cytochrome oxidase c assembly-domain-containing protein n=1 Tax=Penicillium diatomitis TaxID=2819901 RepID=A0A9W9XG03_9EURO|nr:uncharacterized protein N7539_003029 [Penicillium diatomitis]KAJ5491462.1 hypothetical protein N7539_003029 [Penicillium diatomitis]
MSRSAADATRFTATGPYASSKAGSAPYELPSFMQSKDSSKPIKPSAPQTGPDGKPETPKQKVERLRAQARAARMAQQTSGMDRWIESGRKFANRAHKGMVYTLIVASGVCGVLTVYSMVSLTLYNRRQRALWIEKEVESLKQARLAQASGTATAEQLEIIEKEEIGEIVKRKRAEEKAQRPWAKAKRFLFEKLSPEDASVSSSAAGSVAAASSMPAAIESSTPSVTEAVQAQQAFDEAKTKAQATSGAPVLVPGQLDVLAENMELAAKQNTRSWTSWITGR